MHANQLYITNKDMDKRMKIIETPDDPLFFSVVIPAHHEEGYIERTILSLQELDYPRERYEVIIVENGSRDKTDEIIRASSPDWFHILSCPIPGVSWAKNMGIDHLGADSKWAVFLDADTFLQKGFFRELNAFIQSHAAQDLGCGMVSLRPHPDSRLARGWYRFYNFANHVTRTTRSIQLIRRDLLREFRFDEALTFDEDTTLLNQCKARSRYFFLKTDNVFSSTRRFESNGWIRQLAEWIYFASRPYEKKKHIQYRVLR
jgi:glycosyltransferase involved in cell wall biosynthesis